MHFWAIQGRHEADIVIETGRDCVAVEVKASERRNAIDLARLCTFLADTLRCRGSSGEAAGRQPDTGGRTITRAGPRGRGRPAPG